MARRTPMRPRPGQLNRPGVVTPPAGATPPAGGAAPPSPHPSPWAGPLTEANQQARLAALTRMFTPQPLPQPTGGAPPAAGAGGQQSPWESLFGVAEAPRLLPAPTEGPLGSRNLGGPGLNVPGPQVPSAQTAPFADLRQGVIDAGLAGETGENMDADLEAVMANPLLTDEEKRQQIENLIVGGQVRNQASQIAPQWAADLATISPATFSQYIAEFGDDHPVAYALLQQYGPIVMQGYPEDWAAMYAVYRASEIKDENGDPILADIVVSAEMNNRVNVIRRREVEEETQEAALDPLQAHRDFLGGMLTQMGEQAQHNIEEIREAASVSNFTEEDFDRMAADADRLIRQAFGTQLAEETQGISAAGFGRSSFARQMQQQSQTRALQASLGARSELRDLQRRTNNQARLQYTRLLSATRNADQAARLQVGSMLGNMASMVSAIEAGAIFSPSDISEYAVMFNSLMAEYESGQLLDQQLNPGVWETIEDIIGTVLGTIGTRWATGTLGG